MNNKPVYLTAEGLTKLKAELQQLITVDRPRVAARIHDAKLDGDITENAEYEDAKQEQSFLEGRIATLEAQLKNAEVIAQPDGDRVGIGSTVVIKDADGEDKLHHRRLCRGRAARWPDQQRVPGRRCPHGPPQGREGHRPGAVGSDRVHDRLGGIGRPAPCSGPTSSPLA